MVDCRSFGFASGNKAIIYLTSHDVGGFGNERLFNYLKRSLGILMVLAERPSPRFETLPFQPFGFAPVAVLPWACLQSLPRTQNPFAASPLPSGFFLRRTGRQGRLLSA